jgi:hypothetical protein
MASEHATLVSVCMAYMLSRLRVGRLIMRKRTTPLIGFPGLSLMVRGRQT